MSGSVIGDESYFDSLRGTSVSSFQFDPDLTGALSALAFNRGLTTGGTGYIPHPASFAARQLVLALRAPTCTSRAQSRLVRASPPRQRGCWRPFTRPGSPRSCR